MEPQTAYLEIPWPRLLVFCSLVLLPISAFARMQLGLSRAIVSALARMSLQLLLVGVYLEWLFHKNHLGVNLAWLMVMFAVANHKVLQEGTLTQRRFILPSLLAQLATTGAVSALLVIAVLQPTPWYDARFLIPTTGMVLGNCLRGNILALQRCFEGLRENHAVYEFRISLGATRHEALMPWLRDGLNTALRQQIATMATLGIVSLPGMMTGQILGGVPPLIAVQYQIAIMVAIFTAMSLASATQCYLALRLSFDAYDNCRDDIRHTG